jgi:hypothetical protein
MSADLTWLEFDSRLAGMLHAMDGGLWLHRHVWMGRPMAHLVSTDRERLLAYGRAVGLPAVRLQYKPLKDPRSGARRDAWHWDLVREFLPPPTAERRGGPHRPEFDFAVEGARIAAVAGRLARWVAAYLSTGDWADPALRDELLATAPRWAGPLHLPIPVLRIERALDETRVTNLVKSIRHPRYLPPIVATPSNGNLVVRDGAARLEALRRRGYTSAWTIVAARSEEEVERWIERAGDD